MVSPGVGPPWRLGDGENHKTCSTTRTRFLLLTSTEQYLVLLREVAFPAASPGARPSDRLQDSQRFHMLATPANRDNAVFTLKNGAWWVARRCYYAASAAAFSVEGLQPES